MTQANLSTLEAKLNELIQLCEQLHQENQFLRGKEAAWDSERIRLTEKNELARTRVEAMIKRLKNLATEA